MNSLPEQVDKETAKSLFGDKFDEAAFDMAAKDGTVARAELGKFRDESFLPSAKALGMTQAEMQERGITWRRASDLFEGAPLLPPKPGHEMVVQGALNDCYVAASLALVASTGELSSAADGEPLVQHGEVAGQYVVTLMAGGGEKRVVVVDDLIPVTVNGQALFTTARDGACLAFSLIEKALAKHYGSFAVLNGGNTSEALWDLTGCAVEDVKLDGEQKLSAQQCAALVGDAIKRGDLVSCGHIDVKKRGDYAAVCEGGVRMNHAFAVVGASAKEAKVYNPMGYDDGYTNGKTDGEGTLTMSWSEFIRSFTRLQICHLSSRRALPFRKSWATSGEAVLAWSAGRSAGGCTNFSTFRRNPMLRLPRGGEANRKATIEVVVGQRDRRGDTGGEALSYPQLGVCVVRLKEGAKWPCVTAEHYEVVAKSSAFWNKREVAATLEVSLSGDAGETYLVPSTFHPEEAGDFWVSARSDVALDGAEWLSAAARPSALWKGASAKNTVRLGIGGATAGRLCVFVRQTAADGKETSAAAERVPLGVYLIDGDTVLTKAQFCKAGEVSVSFEIDAAKAASPNLAIAPCTFAADKGAQLEVEVMAPDAPSGAATALTLTAASGADPRTLSAAAGSTASTPRADAGSAAKAAPSKGKAAAAKPKTGGAKPKAAAAAGPAPKASMTKAKMGMGALMDDYGAL